MAVLQLFIIMNYSRQIIGFLCVNCIFITHFWHWTRPNPTRPTDGPYPWDCSGILVELRLGGISGNSTAFFSITSRGWWGSARRWDFPFKKMNFCVCMCVCVCGQRATHTARAPAHTPTALSPVTSADLTLWRSLADLTEPALVSADNVVLWRGFVQNSQVC